MAYDMRFSGTLVYGSADDMAEAHAEVEELVEEEDPDFVELFQESHEEWFAEDGANLIVAIDVFGPGDWWFILESIVEIYAGFAVSGVVDSWYDDEPNEQYGPDAGY